MAKGERIKKLAVSNKHYRYYTFEHFLKNQECLGNQNVELWGGTPHVWIDVYEADDAKEMKKQIDGYGLNVSAFMPEFSSFRYSLGIPDALIHEASVEYLKRCAHYASQLETDYMLLDLNGYNLDGDFAVQWDSLLKTMYRLSKITEQEGIRCAVFNGMSDGTNIVNTNGRLYSCLNTINSPNIVPALDLSAMYIAAESVEMWMKTWGDRLSYVHIVDHDGDTFSGDGKIDDNSLLETLQRLENCGYDGMIGVMAENRKHFLEPIQWDCKMTRYFNMYF